MPCLVGWQEGRCLWWTPLSCQLHCTNAVSIDVRMLTVPASGCCKAGPQAGRRTALATHAAHSLACAHTVTRAPLTSWARRRGLQCRQGTPTACMHACMHAHTHTHVCVRAHVSHTRAHLFLQLIWGGLLAPCRTARQPQAVRMPGLHLSALLCCTFVRQGVHRTCSSSSDGSSGRSPGA